eukprot:256865-Amphidinium_carterae.1
MQTDGTLSSAAAEKQSTMASRLVRESYPSFLQNVASELRCHASLGALRSSAHSFQARTMPFAKQLPTRPSCQDRCRPATRYKTRKTYKSFIL